MKPRQLPRKWFLIGLLVLLIAGAVALPRQIGTSSQLRDRIGAVLSEWSGGTITLTEPLRIRYFPPLSLRGGFILTNATKLPGIGAITAPDVEFSLDFADLLLGRTKIDALRISKPVITLKETDAAAPEDSPISGALVDPPLGTVRMRGGTIKNAYGVPIVKDFEVRLDPKGRRGALAALGSFHYRGETVAFAMDTGTVAETEDGTLAPVTLKVTADGAKAEFSGKVRAADRLEAEGELEAEMSDARHVLNWLGMSLPKGESLHDVKGSGMAHWSGTTLTFDRGAFSLDGNEAVGLLVVTAGDRPRIEGTLDFERLVLDPYLGTSEAAKDRLFDRAILRYLDADLRLSAAEIAALTLELGRGGLTLTAKDGAISSEIGALELCGGLATGRVSLNLSEARPEASLAGNLSDAAVETCLAQFDLDVPIKGTGVLKVDVSTGGETRDELIRNLVGKFEVAAKDGAVPIDLSALASGAGEGKAGWSQDATTAFETLDANCQLTAGHVWCQSFTMQTPQGTISGSGGVDVGKQTIDWNFLIANPVTPLNASQLVMESPPRVTIRGPLTQPEVRGADRPAPADASSQPSSESGSAAPSTQNAPAD
jgi:AsmA protein